MTTAEQFYLNTLTEVFSVNIPEITDKYLPQELIWEKINEKLYTIVPATDSNSLLHCFATAFDGNYILGISEDLSLDKKESIKKYRNYLAVLLQSKVVTTEDKITEDFENHFTQTETLKYNTLFNGKLSELSEINPDVSLFQMVSLLQSDDKLTEIFVELISDLVKCDVYILDFETKTVKPTNTGYGFIISNRRSIVLLDIDHSYHLVYVKRNNVGQMVFDTNDFLISDIKSLLNL